MSHIGHNSGTLSPEHMAHELSRRGHEWADKHAAAEVLEQTIKSILAEIAQDYRQSGKTSMTEAESLARADKRYRQHVAEMVAARREANKARVNFDVYRSFIEMARTKEATQRAEMSMR